MSLFLLLCLLLSTGTVRGQSPSDDALRTIAFDEKLGSRISLDLAFRDETGQPVRLRSYFDKKPVILVLGYYRCPMLCSAVLNGMIGGLQDVKWQMGRDYEVVNVSIDPDETPALAAAKKQSYVARFGQPGAANGWHFLTGDEPAIRKLAGEVGFNYIYDPALHQYAHPSGLTVLSPTGVISHYLSGVDFSSADLTEAISDAARTKIGSPIEQIFLLCFHYNPVTGRYSGVILTVVRVLGLVVPLALVGLIVGVRRRLAKGAA